MLREDLLPFIAGNSSDRQNIAHTYAISQTLGELHHALAEFDSSGKMAQLPAWGDLNHIHPLVTPLEIPKLLKLTLQQQHRLVKTFTEVIETAPNLYKTLPVQTTHADYLSPNVMLLENRVVGVLDFEFATFDLRLMDYVAALDHFTRFSGEAPSLEFVKAFSTGYAIARLPFPIGTRSANISLAFTTSKLHCLLDRMADFGESNESLRSRCSNENAAVVRLVVRKYCYA